MRAFIAFFLALLLPTALLACLWDYDTLKMERQRFPDALELITGKFLRHSPEFYAWRIQDRQERLKREPENLSLYDDLAVAFEKTGQRDKAIETILQKDKLKPGLYETEANLGTFLMLDGQLEKALPHLEKAIKINPDAHFGREKYQVMLLQYMLSRQKDGQTTLPLGKEETPDANFYTFVASKLATGKKDLNDTERAAAIKGVLGMMKFADYESPVLLEALGNLLADWDESGDGNQLAARAYLKASFGTQGEETKQAYRKMARNALFAQRNVSLELAESELQVELKEANEWYAVLREKELEWIKDGKNADEEFNQFYDKPPEVLAKSAADIKAEKSIGDSSTIGSISGVRTEPVVQLASEYRWTTARVALVVLLGVLSGIMLWHRIRQTKTPPSKGPYV